jgi:hypothetical protein
VSLTDKEARTETDIPGLPIRAHWPSTMTDLAQATPLTRLRGSRGRRVPVICLAILLIDQASKAVQPAGTFIVNTGGATILPSALGDTLWKSQTFGAACDTIDTVLLVAALALTEGWRTSGTKWRPPQF